VAAWNVCHAFAFLMGAEVALRWFAMSLIDFSGFRFEWRKHVNPSSLRCDHCRTTLGSNVIRYWQMKFCSASCMGAYRRRLSPGTQQKIEQLDIARSSWKAAS
jgi:hypothetical protein